MDRLFGSDDARSVIIGQNLPTDGLEIVYIRFAGCGEDVDESRKRIERERTYDLRECALEFALLEGVGHLDPDSWDHYCKDRV